MKKSGGTLFSMPRETENMVQKILEISQRRMPQETERYMRQVVQNMKDRLRHDESISETSMHSEKKHISIWTRCTASSMQAALHMTRVTKKWELFENSEFENIKKKDLFGITRMMIEGNSEIKNVFPADVASSLWGKPVLLKEQYSGRK